MRKNKLLLLLVLLLMAATGAWADTTVTWTTSDISSGLFVDFVDGTVINNTIKGITATGSIGGDGNWSGTDIYSGDANNTITFTSSVGNIKSIVIKADQINLNSNPTAGWTLSPETLFWSGEASSTVSLTFSSWDGISDISEIVFTIAPTGYSITLDEGTGNKDSQNWEITPKSSELSGKEDVTVKYNGSREVKSVTVVKKVEKAVDNTYQTWDGTQKKLVAAKIPAEVTTVANADADVEWQAGTYVVEGQVNINGTIELSGDVDLIIKDGAKLIVNNSINGNFDYSLSIYGQAQKTGELVVNGSDYDAILNLPTLEVHSAKVTATASGNDKHGGINSIKTFNVYGGLFDAKSAAADGGFGILLSGGGSMDIWGGEVKAEGKKDGDWDCGIVCGSTGNKATITVHGGKLWAGNADKKAFNFVTLTIDKSSFSGKIETSDDDKSWTEYTSPETPGTKYVRVGY